MSSSLFEQRTKVYNQKFETKSAYFDFWKSPNASKPSPNYVPSDFMSQAQSDIVNIEDSISQIDQREIDLRKNFKIFVFKGFPVNARWIAPLATRELI